MSALLRAEVLKLRTTRTFLALAGLAVGTSLLITTLVSLLTEPTGDSVLTDVFTSDTSSLFILVLAVVGISGSGATARSPARCSPNPTACDSWPPRRSPSRWRDCSCPWRSRCQWPWSASSCWACAICRPRPRRARYPGGAQRQRGDAARRLRCGSGCAGAQPGRRGGGAAGPGLRRRARADRPGARGLPLRPVRGAAHRRFGHPPEIRGWAGSICWPRGSPCWRCWDGSRRHSPRARRSSGRGTSTRP